MASSQESTTPPNELTSDEKAVVFQYFCRQLAGYRNTCKLYAVNEFELSGLPQDAAEKREQIVKMMNDWAQDLLEKAWIVYRQSCEDEEEEPCPIMDDNADTSTAGLPPLPPVSGVRKDFNAILFLHIATTKQYSAYTRSFFSQFQPPVNPNEQLIVTTLKNPESAISEAQAQAEALRSSHADKGKTYRIMGMGLGAVAGGVLIGVTGGLAAPVVGAGVTTVLSWLGIGGTAVGLFASGLAGSSMICGALFGAYGAKSTAEMVGRHTREVRDLEIKPLNTKKGEETLGVRLCISGWLESMEDVCAPWTIFEGDDTYALQWETGALKQLSDALYTAIQSEAMKYVKALIIKRTVLAGLMSALSPVALLKIGQIMDNPWMNARALALKTGDVLGDLLSKRAFGNRPVTLVGYSLGSLVIFQALQYLSKLPVSESFGIIQDVFLFGTPAPATPQTWARARRVTAGRLVNGYASGDYVMAVLSRAADTSWRVAGLNPVEVQGVENLHCADVKGHTMWRGMVGKYLEELSVPGIVKKEVEMQVKNVASKLVEEEGEGTLTS